MAELKMLNGTSNGELSAAKAKIQEAASADAPPDGGTRAWLVMIGAFYCNGILFGVINCYSILYGEIYDSLSAENATDASSKTALIGSLAMGTTFMASPIAGVLVDIIGIPYTTLIGGALASGGMFISSFVSHNVNAMCVTYGFMYGFGCALSYTPSLTILGHYFKNYIGIVNGVVTTGSSVFTMLLPNIMSYALENYGIVWTLRLLALLSTGVMGAAFLFKPRQSKPIRKQVQFSNVINVKIFKNHRYLLWVILIAISLTGYFIPYVHMMKFVQENYSADHDPKWPVICIGISSGMGRIVFGYISDLPKMNRILMQQAAFLVIGGVTALLPSTAGSFQTLIAMTLLMGIFDGCFVSLLGPIVITLLGPQGASQGIGTLLGLCSIPLTLGPYIAGMMYDHMHSYTLAFRLAGIPPILGAIALFFINCIKDEKVSDGKVYVGDNGNVECLKLNGNGEIARLASAGTLFSKRTVSSSIWSGEKKKTERCYSYSIL